MPRPVSFPATNYIPALQRTGVSARQALLFLRGNTAAMSADALQTLRESDVAALEGKGGVRTQNFQWQWGAISRSVALRDRLGNVPTEHIPTASEITQGRFARARGYQYNVDVLVREHSTGQVYLTPMAVVTDTLISTGDAITRALNNLRYIQSQAHIGGNRDTLPITILSGGVVTDVIERLPLLAEEEEE